MKLKSLSLIVSVVLLSGCGTTRVGSPICPALSPPPPVLMQKVQHPSYFPPELRTPKSKTE